MYNCSIFVIHLLIYNSADTSLMIEKLTLKCTQQNDKEKHANHCEREKCSRLYNSIVIVFICSRYPAEVTARKIDVRCVHFAAAALIAVAMSGTSMEKIPSPF